MLHADLAGVTDDIQYLLTKVPGHIADVREIIERGAGYLPQIKGIVVKAGSKLPQVADVVNKGIQYLPTIQAIVEDPALPQLVQRVQTLRSLESQARAEAASSGKPQPGPAGAVGVGLHRFVKPLDYYIDYRKTPAKYYAFLGLGLAAVLGGGFIAGRWTKNCRR